MSLDRREFMRLSATASALAAGGFLPLLAAENERVRRRPVGRPGGATGPRNIFTQPPAIEPITGFLPRFKPARAGSMGGAFAATYTLVQMLGAPAKSRNMVAGSLAVSFNGKTCASRETRRNRPANVTDLRVECAGDLNLAQRWTLRSAVEGLPDLTFVETGSCNGNTVTVRAKSWAQKWRASLPLISQWALLPLLAAGRLKARPLEFDMLDNTALRPGQLLRYCGRLNIAVAGGSVGLDCYAQTGYGVLPVHYMVDDGGRVQLITQETVNWALTKLGTG